MKKRTKHILTGAIAVVLIMTVISAIFTYVAMTNDFDHNLGHFKVGAASAAIAIYLPIAAAAVSFICSLFIRKKMIVKEEPAANIPTVFASVLLGLLLIVSVVLALVFPQLSANPRISLFVVITATISGIYFILLPFAKNKSFMIFLSFVPALWAALKLLEEYFRIGDPINSPIRTITLTMYAFLLLFFTEEVRFKLGTQLPAVYYFCTLSAVAFTGNAAFSKLAVILAGNQKFEFSFIDCAIGVSAFMVLLARLSSLPKVLADHDSANADEKSDTAFSEAE